MTTFLRISVAIALSLLGDCISLRRASDQEVLRRNASTSLREECSLDDVRFYILNLDRRREDKFAAMKGVINRDAPFMCDKACRVSAPDGSKWGKHISSHIMPDKQWQTIKKGSVFESKGYPHLTPGAVALTVGHGRMWEHAVQSGARFAVVMEDDLIRFHPEFEPLLCYITHHKGLQRGWDFLLMQEGFKFVDGARLPIIHADGGMEERHKFNTGMYIIKVDAATKALNYTFPMSEPFVQLDDPHSALWSKLRGGHTDPPAADAGHDITDVQTGLLRKKTGSGKCHINDCKPLDKSRTIVPELFNPTAGDK